MTTEAATEVKTQVAPAEPKPLEKLTPKEDAEWRLTGKLPTAEPARKEPSTEPAAESASEGTEALPEPKKVTKMGYGELRARVRELEAEAERLKAASKQPEAAAEPLKAEKQRPKPKMDDKKEDGAPKYETMEEYFEDLADWKAESKINEVRTAESKRQQEAVVARINAEIEAKVGQRIEKFKADHADFDQVVEPALKRIGKGSAVDGFVLDSERGPAILYHFAKNPADLERYAEMSPYQAVRELIKLEASLGETKQVPPAKEPPITTKTPPPAKEVGGRGSQLVDDAENAVVNDDVAAYIAAANRRELAKRKQR